MISPGKAVWARAPTKSVAIDKYRINTSSFPGSVQRREPKAR